MTKINLLPWRETYRQEKNKDFYIMLVVFAAIGAAIAFGHFKFVADQVAHQNKRNSRLDTEIAALQKELEEIKQLEETKSNLLARMDIIQQLQGQRPLIVHTFDEIAGRIPDGVFLTALKQSSDKNLIVEGRAESNARVSALMRQMDQSDYFSNPVLEVIAADKERGFSTFKLSLQQQAPTPEKDSTDGI